MERKALLLMLFLSSLLRKDPTPFIILFSFSVSTLGSIATISAEKKVTIEPEDAFRMVQNVLCKDYEKESCTYENFEIKEVDLNGDGRSEWIFAGPSEQCGAHGNCPFMIFRISGRRWKPLYSGWVNWTESKILNTRHKGYLDLEIASDMGSFYWFKEKLVWNGARYIELPNSTTYYLYDGKKLVRVSRKRWEECIHKGQGCL